MTLKTAAVDSGKPAVELPSKPEDQELALKREEQAAIESDLADRELRCASLRAELASFERRYLHFIGARYAELDELKALVAEKLAAQQPSNATCRLSAEQARARSNETKSAAGVKESEEPKSFQPSAHTKKLYREVARRIHPDLTADREDRAKRQQLMAEANQAYECGDEAQLARILTEYEYRPEAVTGEGAGAELIRVIRRISQAKSRMAEIEAALQEMTRSDLYQLKRRFDEATELGHDILKEMTAKVEDQITRAKQLIESTVHKSL